MKLEELIEKFGIGTEERRKAINNNRVPESFKNIAQCILSGHFEIREGTEIARRVFPTCVEIYYHEESNNKDAIKDYIVYHRKKYDKAPGLFSLGSFNTHQSGIDITFEYQDNNGNEVRASALIRKYLMEDYRYKVNSPLTIKNKIVDDRSTYLYEALFADLSIIKGFSIQWIDGKEQKDIADPIFRKNVLPYEKDDKDAHKIRTNIKNDGRCWQFSVKNQNYE